MKKINTLKQNILALLNYYTKKVVLANCPTYLWIEPTNYCNLQCIMCPNGTGQVNIKKGFMEYSSFQKIINEIQEYASNIVLAVNGESLMHADFFKMVDYASSKGIKIHLNTNATLLDEVKTNQLLDVNISSISFAFDGFNKDMYEKARRGADFDKTLTNILNFLKLKKQRNKKNPYTILSILMLGVGDYSDDEKNKLLAMFDGLIDEVRLREVATWGSTFKDTKDFKARKHDGIFLPCSRLWSSLCVAWNGDVLPCIYNANHEFVLGNINDESLKEIWNGKKLLDLRRAMLDRSYLKVSPLCENCIVIGSPPLLGVPSGIRLSLADALVNFLGYRLEKHALQFANFLKKGMFSSTTIK